MKKDTPAKLSHLSIALHWIVGFAMIGLLGVGVFMAETQAYGLYPIHKSLGFLIFFVALARVIWRVKNGWPAAAGQYTSMEKMLSKLVHWVLILATVLMPLSGFLMSALGGTGVDLFGMEIVARNTLPDNPQRPVAHNEALAGFFGGVHSTVGWVLILAVVLHVAGAIKHKVIDKDGTLPRMLGAKIES